MKYALTALGIAALAAAAPGYAQDTGDSGESGALTTTESTDLLSPSYLGILGLYTLPDDEREYSSAGIDRGTGIDLLYGWQGDSGWGYELHGAVEAFETGKTLRTDFYHYKLGADVFYAFADRTTFTPFVLIGGGGSYNDVYPNTVEDDDYDFFANAGLGFVTGPFTKVGQLRLRGEARYVYDHFVDGDGDIRFGLGIEIPLFEERIVQVPVPQPEPRVVEVEKRVEVPTGVSDSDGDGIVDDKDKCPATESGVRVDGEGCPLEKIINLKGVTFEFDKTRLRPDAETILDWAVEILLRYPDMQVEVAGHTDNVGSDSYNQTLSEGRAAAVRTYFVEHGVPESQMTVKGYGESEPIADNDSEDGRERNRRVELRILN